MGVVRARHVWLAILAIVFTFTISVPAVFAQELCDGVDNDGDGTIDEDFPVGEVCLVGVTSCEGRGSFVCSADGTGVECDAEPLPPSVEGPAGDPTCFDALDNDCDGDFDHADVECQSEEFCDGFDNDDDGDVDEDFTDLRRICSAGQGACEEAGIHVCTVDGTATACNAVAGAPGSEDAPNHIECIDGLDNDCDGMIDLDDPGCQSPEACDGRDNDGDAEIDEDFAGLGENCAVGVGDCEVVATYECSPDGSAVVCPTAPGPEGIEGPRGPSCSDGRDNDCDGAVDAADIDCAFDAVHASCKFEPFGLIAPGVGFVRLQPDLQGVESRDGVTVRQSILALDVDGAIIERVEVEAGQPLRLNLDDDVEIRRLARPVSIAAPRLLGQVEVAGSFDSISGFCSPFPTVKVVTPDGSVVSQDRSGGLSVPVVAAVPEIEYESIRVLVDGVDVLDELDVDLLDGPHSGTITLPDGSVVAIEDLRIDAFASAVRMRIDALPAGGHIVRVIGDGREPTEPTIPAVRPFLGIQSRGLLAAIGVDIESPQAGAQLPLGPVQVDGTVSHGLPIASASVQGVALPVDQQVYVRGDGLDRPDTYRLEFQVDLPLGDLPEEFATARVDVESLDPGANVLVVEASDEFANAAFATRPVTLGPISNVARFRRSSHELPDAFVALISQSGLVEMLEPACDRVRQEAGRLFSRLGGGREMFRVCAFNPDQRCIFDEQCPPFMVGPVSFQACVPERVEFPVNNSCDPDMQLWVDEVEFDPRAVACQAFFLDGAIIYDIQLPRAQLHTRLKGDCNQGLFGLIQGLKIDATVDLDLTSSVISTTIDEETLLNGGDLPVTVPIGPSVRLAGYQVTVTISGAAALLINLADWLNISAIPSGALDSALDNGLSDLTADALDGADGTLLEGTLPPIQGFDGIGAVDLDRSIDSLGVSLEAEPVNAEIRPFGGVRVSYAAGWAPNTIDPQQPTPVGGALGSAPPPTPPPGGGDLGLAISVDSLNQLLAALTASGAFVSVDESGTTLQDVGLGWISVLPQYFFAGIRPTTEVVTVARAYVPPQLVLDDAHPSPAVEVGVRANDVRVKLVADRAGDGLSVTESQLRGCVGSDPSGFDDCILYELCMDLNMLGSAGIAQIGGVPNLSMSIDEIQVLNDAPGLSCASSADPADADEAALLATSAMNPVLERLRQRINDGLPAIAASGLSLGGNLTVTDPRLISVPTGGNPRLDDYLAIVGQIGTRDAVGGARSSPESSDARQPKPADAVELASPR